MRIPLHWNSQRQQESEREWECLVCIAKELLLWNTCGFSIKILINSQVLNKSEGERPCEGARAVAWKRKQMITHTHIVIGLTLISLLLQRCVCEKIYLFYWKRTHARKHFQYASSNWNHRQIDWLIDCPNGSRAMWELNAAFLLFTQRTRT